MLFETPPLRLLRLSFELRPKRPMYMSVEERGNALRGGFGTAFRQLVCDPACPGAANCSSRQQCPYACLFEPIWPEAASRLGTLDVPRPFVFRPSLSPDSAFNSSRLLQFELRLMGQAVVHYEFFLRAFRRLAICGLGHARVPFDLVSVRSLDWSGQVPATLLEDGCPTGVAPVPLTFQPLMEQMGHADSTVLDFVTPVLIKEHGVELRVPTFSAVLKRLRDRLSHLCLAYEGRRWEADYGAIGEAAARAVVTSEQGQWEARSRVSSRTGRSTHLSGFCGRIAFERVDPDLMPLLLIGQEIHLGRHAAWGNGWYRVQLDDKKLTQDRDQEQRIATLFAKS
jgi:hypothetical protein